MDFKPFEKKLTLGLAAALALLARRYVREKRTEEKIRKSKEPLRNLAAHLQWVREEERSRIAREIHDSLGQELTGLKMDLSWMEKQFHKNGGQPERGKLIDKIHSMAELINTMVREVQKISSDLRPGILDLGLIPALEWQAQEFEKRSGIRCAVTDRLPENAAVDATRSTTLFRIFQETLTNVMRHTAATEVNVIVRLADGCLTMEVSDNGTGIRDEDLSDPKSLGILGMRERALLLGGSVQIRGIEDYGTVVTVRIPLTVQTGGAHYDAHPDSR